MRDPGRISNKNNNATMQDALHLCKTCAKFGTCACRKCLEALDEDATESTVCGGDIKTCLDGCYSFVAKTV